MAFRADFFISEYCRSDTPVGRIVHLYERVVDGLALVAGLSLGGMALWVTYEVIARYLFHSPTIWANDLSEYTLLASTFLAAPWVLRQEGHVTVDIVVVRLGAPARRAMGVAVSIAGAVICAIYTWYTAESVIEYYERGYIIARQWEVPQYLVHIAIPIGSALLIVEFIRRARRIAAGEAAPAATSPTTPQI